MEGNKFIKIYLSTDMRKKEMDFHISVDFFLTNWSNDCRLKTTSLQVLDRGGNNGRIKIRGSRIAVAEIIWSNEPLPSGELVKLCEQKLGWKKSTTYTVLKRLCERGIFQNEKGMVSARMTKEEYDAAQSEKFVEDNFGGSLPAFLAAFTTRKKLNKSEVDEIKKMIDAIGKEG